MFLLAFLLLVVQPSVPHRTVEMTPVAGIGDYAFYKCKKLKSVAVPKGVTNVAWSAFCECSVEKIYVEKGDAERVRALLRGKGVDVDRAAFVERDGVHAFSHSGKVEYGPRRPVEIEYEKEKQHED